MVVAVVVLWGPVGGVGDHLEEWRTARLVAQNCIFNVAMEGNKRNRCCFVYIVDDERATMAFVFGLDQCHPIGEQHFERFFELRTLELISWPNCATFKSTEVRKGLL